jgi:hypothetical protein
MTKQTKKNKISTMGYFIKRLKDNDFVVWKVFNKYGHHDHRLWTVMVNPGEESVYITCYVNTDELGSAPVFEIQSGSSLFRNYAKIQTRSMEVIISHLLKRGVQQNSETYRVTTNTINTNETHVKKTETTT